MRCADNSPARQWHRADRENQEGAALRLWIALTAAIKHALGTHGLTAALMISAAAPRMMGSA
jgi:hypothetical protein